MDWPRLWLLAGLLLLAAADRPAGEHPEPSPPPAPADPPAPEEPPSPAPSIWPSPSPASVTTEEPLAPDPSPTPEDVVTVSTTAPPATPFTTKPPSTTTATSTTLSSPSATAFTRSLFGGGVPRKTTATTTTTTTTTAPTSRPPVTTSPAVVATPLIAASTAATPPHLRNDAPALVSTAPAPPEFKFTRSSYNVSIPENSVAKTFVIPEERMGIYTLLNDPEFVIRYKIIDGDRDKFFKAEEKMVGDFCFLLLRTRTGNTAVLNRERKDKYVLEIRATGTRKEAKNKSTVSEADTTVIVTVTDTNDLNPLFYPTEYEESVPEDTPLHRSILKVSAEDADIGRNGEIYYSFKEPTEHFAVHPMTGVVSLTRQLRYAERSLHELTVLAQDRSALLRAAATSTSARASSARLRVRVQQVNLYSPEIYVQYLPDIVEHSNANIYAIVRVLDRDHGIHGQIDSVEIVDGDPDGHFRVRPASDSGSKAGEFNIEVIHLLDRELAPQGYNLTLKATDKGVPPKVSYKSVPVHLTDLNDNPPVFDREKYEVEVPETAPVNTPVIRLKVTDADEGKNAQVFLEIVGGNEGGEFRINPDTGMLYTAIKLDAEQKAFYSLTVSAIDQGNTGTRKQSSAKITINVVDTNDNDPLFDSPELTVWVDENEPAGSSVTKVTARDRDSGENAYISYSIANLNPVPFEIDHFSGVVKTTTVLDYESMRRE